MTDSSTPMVDAAPFPPTLTPAPLGRRALTYVLDLMAVYAVLNWLAYLGPGSLRSPLVVLAGVIVMRTVSLSLTGRTPAFVLATFEVVTPSPPSSWTSRTRRLLVRSVIEALPLALLVSVAQFSHARATLLEGLAAAVVLVVVDTAVVPRLSLSAEGLPGAQRGWTAHERLSGYLCVLDEARKKAWHLTGTPWRVRLLSVLMAVLMLGCWRP